MLIREHSAITRRGLTEQPLAGQHALVTGANSGIGKVVAVALAEAGAAVAVNYVAGEDEAHAVTDQIAAAGGQAIAPRADVSARIRSRRCSRRLALPSTLSTTSSPMRAAARSGDVSGNAVCIETITDRNFTTAASAAKLKR